MKNFVSMMAAALLWATFCTAVGIPFWFNFWGAAILGWYWTRIYDWVARYVQKR